MALFTSQNTGKGNTHNSVKMHGFLLQTHTGYVVFHKAAHCSPAVCGANWAHFTLAEGCAESSVSGETWGLIPSELRVTSRGSRCLQLLHVGIGSAFLEQSLGYV